MTYKHIISHTFVAKRLAAMGSLSLLMCLAMSPAVNAMQATPAASTQNDATRIQNIISRGNQEITRRLSRLGTLSSKISGATKLASSDKAALLTEVTNEISGLTALKTKLDAETTLAGAKADAQSIFNDYRVYALIVPKVELVRVADDEQVTTSKLTALATKLQTRISEAQSKGKNVSSLSAKLADMQAQTAAAQNLASSIEAKVINLQPSDYNSDHAILSGDAAQLKTAHADNQAAYTDAKAIVSGLKSL